MWSFYCAAADDSSVFCESLRTCKVPQPRRGQRAGTWGGIDDSGDSCGQAQRRMSKIHQACEQQIHSRGFEYGAFRLHVESLMTRAFHRQQFSVESPKLLIDWNLKRVPEKVPIGLGEAGTPHTHQRQNAVPQRGEPESGFHRQHRQLPENRYRCGQGFHSGGRQLIRPYVSPLGDARIQREPYL